MRAINIYLLTTLALMLALVVYVYTARPALAAMDYTCFNQCLSQGGTYGVCQKVCSF